MCATLRRKVTGSRIWASSGSGSVLRSRIFSPIYGSSELIKRAPNKATEFFESYPSGFAVSPVGRPRCTSLILLEKLGAGAAEARGRKVAICVSPVWFLAKGANGLGFAGNFSPMQASELFFNAPLSLGLKHDVAGQMLRYPQVFRKSWLLAATAEWLASDRLSDRVLYFATMPLGWLQNTVYRLQDHFEIARSMRGDHKLRHLIPRKSETLDWDRLMAAAVPLVRPLPQEVFDSRFRYFADDAGFLEAMDRSYEWGDFDLLLRAVRELGLDPLLLSMPIEHAHYERMGISPQAIDAYDSRLRAFADRYHVPVVDFTDLGDDPQFFADHFGHPSAKGWI